MTLQWQPTEVPAFGYNDQISMSFTRTLTAPNGGELGMSVTVNFGGDPLSEPDEDDLLAYMDAVRQSLVTDGWSFNDDVLQQRQQQGVSRMALDV